MAKWHHDTTDAEQRIEQVRCWFKSLWMWLRSPYGAFLTGLTLICLVLGLSWIFQIFCYPVGSIYHNANPLWCN